MNEEKYVEAKRLVLETSRRIKSEVPKKRFSLDRASHSEIRRGEILDGEPIDRIALILRGTGCEYALNDGGCTMCGFYTEQDGIPRTPEHYVTQLRLELAKYDLKKYPVLCLYNNGSFFNDSEITPGARSSLLRYIATKPFKKLVVETRADSLTEGKIADAIDILQGMTLEVAVGLETLSEEVRDLCINKGVGLEDYIRTARIIHNEGAKLRSYVLVKPPFLTEGEAVDDAVNSIRYAQDILKSDSVHIEVITVQEHTMQAFLEKKGYFRVPWLWSIIEILKQTELPVCVTPFSYVASITSVAHNCGFCDGIVSNAIFNQYNINYDRKTFEGLECDCKKQWQKEVNATPVINPLPERIMYILKEVG